MLSIDRMKMARNTWRAIPAGVLRWIETMPAFNSPLPPAPSVSSDKAPELSIGQLVKAIEGLACRPPRIALSVDEAADALGLTRREIQGAINRGEIRAKKMGNNLRIAVSELQRLFENG